MTEFEKCCLLAAQLSVTIGADVWARRDTKGRPFVALDVEVSVYIHADNSVTMIDHDDNFAEHFASADVLVNHLTNSRK